MRNNKQIYKWATGSYEESIRYVASRSSLARKCLKMPIGKLKALQSHYSTLSDKEHSKRRIHNKRLALAMITSEIMLYRINEII